VSARGLDYGLIVLGSGLVLFVAVDALTADRHPAVTERWTVPRRGYADWLMWPAGDLDPAGPRFWTRRGAVAWASKRWPVAP